MNRHEDMISTGRMVLQYCTKVKFPMHIMFKETNQFHFQRIATLSPCNCTEAR